jgi:2-polyprenyl-3-methyl-5-hydroxy-6-metoxy-1,4-benzoquinol methylase
MDIKFTAHNILLDDGNCTLQGVVPVASSDWFIAAKRIFNTVFPGSKSSYRIADLGCLEGGFSVEFARMGFNVVGIEVRESNILACNYVKEHVNLPNLEFVQDDVWNLAKYGSFDAVFCCGLLYHLDRPVSFLNLMSSVTKKLLIVQTHFSTEQLSGKFNLSDIVTNENVEGRWYTEFATDQAFAQREQSKWSSWDNSKSFWVKHEYLLQAIKESGFDTVLEQFDSLGNIAESINSGYYKTDSRGTFVGIKS